MKQLVLTLAGIFFSQAVVLCAQGASHSEPTEYIEPATVPSALSLHVGQSLVLRVYASGYQVYQCGTAEGSPTWILSGPDANLFDGKRNLVGSHFATSGSPTWRLNDGSEITAKKVAAAPSPDGSAVPWLMLTVSAHSGKSGLLNEVTTVQRVNTSGGLAPASGCDANHQGRITKSPYSAEYYFSK